MNIGYFFGNIEQIQEVSFDSLFAPYRNVLTADIGHGGFTWNAGIQNDIAFSKKKEDGSTERTGKYLTLGLYGNSQLNFNTTSTVFNSRFNPVYPDLDTIVFNPEATGSGTLPAEISFG